MPTVPHPNTTWGTSSRAKSGAVLIMSHTAKIFTYGYDQFGMLAGQQPRLQYNRFLAFAIGDMGGHITYIDLVKLCTVNNRSSNHHMPQTRQFFD